jgi:carbonic anhydrase
MSRPAPLSLAPRARSLSLSPRPGRRRQAAVLFSLPALVLALGALLWPLHSARAQDGHGEPASGAAKAPTQTPTHTVVKPSSLAKELANDDADGAKAAAPSKPLSMDDLSRKLSDKVAAVRDRQDRTPTPTLKLAARAPATAGTGHGAAPLVPDKAARPAQIGAADAQAHAAHDIHWAYNGDGGPSHWAEIKPDFAACAKGQRQSPIDIRGGLRVDLETIKFDYRPVGFGVIDNGHTIQANLQPGNAIEVAGRRYDLLQFHFHRPSEERINGRQFEMVVHLVHKDPEGRLAVVAVLIESGRSHPVIQSVWNSLPLERNEELASPVALDLNQLLPEDRRYYTYMGSLTTPPCSEGVLWMVLKQPATLSPDQIGLFARLYPMNARPIQQVGGRMIKESN